MEDNKMKCPLCVDGPLEYGDTLYSWSDWDGGIGFDYVRPVRFCPLCGRKLPETLSLEREAD